MILSSGGDEADGRWMRIPHWSRRREELRFEGMTESCKDSRMYMSMVRAHIAKTNSVQKAGTGIRLDMHAC